MMTEEELDSTIDMLTKSALVDRRSFDEIWLSLIKQLRKERDTYRFLLEQETKRSADLVNGF